MADAKARDLVVNGKSLGTTYVFEKAGDELPVHVHETDDTNHITLVMFGSVQCIGDEKIAGMILEAQSGGTIVKWPVGILHGFRALTDGATITNILLVPGR